MRSRDRGDDGSRRLSGPNPFIDLSDVELAVHAARLVDELLQRKTRTRAERLALTERCAYLLVLCNQRLMRAGRAAPASTLRGYSNGGFYPPALPADHGNEQGPPAAAGTG